MTASHPLFSDPRNRRALTAIALAAAGTPPPTGRPQRWTLFLAAPTGPGGRACWMPKTPDAHLAAVWRHALSDKRTRMGLTAPISALHITVLPGATRRSDSDYEPTVHLIQGVLDCATVDVIYEAPQPGQACGLLIAAWTGR